MIKQLRDKEEQLQFTIERLNIMEELLRSKTVEAQDRTARLTVAMEDSHAAMKFFQLKPWLTNIEVPLSAIDGPTPHWRKRAMQQSGQCSRVVGESQRS